MWLLLSLFSGTCCCSACTPPPPNPHPLFQSPGRQKPLEHHKLRGQEQRVSVPPHCRTSWWPSSPGHPPSARARVLFSLPGLNSQGHQAQALIQSHEIKGPAWSGPGLRQTQLPQPAGSQGRKVLDPPSLLHLQWSDRNGNPRALGAYLGLAKQDKKHRRAGRHLPTSNAHLQSQPSGAELRGIRCSKSSSATQWV